MNETLLVNDYAVSRETIHGVIASEDYSKRHAPDNWHNVTTLAEEPTDQATAESFTTAELQEALNEVLAGCLAAEIEVVSATPEWVELRVPCTLGAIEPLQKLLTSLDADLPLEIGEAISYTFREMFNNAVEHGGRFDPAKRVEIRFVRLKRAVLCHIKDPGEGFDPTRLQHAAINNPKDDPFRHVAVREEKGLRSGGLGILITNLLVDELVYNEQHNELMFVKYLF